ncbi:hypothetical protein Tco_0115695 [Tanacetum coccineum]
MVGTPGLNESEVLQGVPIQIGLSTDEMAKRSFEESTLYIPEDLITPANNEALTKLNYLFVNMKHDFVGTVKPAAIQSLQRELDKTPPELLARKLESIYKNELISLDNYLAFFEGNFSSQDYLNHCDELARLVSSSPLEQFSILPLIPMKIGNLYFSFTNSSLFMLLTLSLVLLLIHFVTKKGGGNLVPNAWQSLVELIYDFVLNLGMIPYSFTVTSHFLITLGDLGPLFIVLALTGLELVVRSIVIWFLHCDLVPWCGEISAIKEKRELVGLILQIKELTYMHVDWPKKAWKWP